MPSCLSFGKQEQGIVRLMGWNVLSPHLCARVWAHTVWAPTCRLHGATSPWTNDVIRIR